MTCPLIQAPSSDSRKATRAAMSVGRPTRGPRIRLSADFSRSGHCGTARIASVAVKPGATALHRTPVFPQRVATCRVSAPTPAFEAAYAGQTLQAHDRSFESRLFLAQLYLYSHRGIALGT
ncbi:hypothetical protein A5790_19795 [Mycobacterium sp. 852002-51152_SCH6134967]|nr:hypothetical protein A5790_19795 [Mycobacterium sp. 852002-51152_SCH6134967]